MYSFVPITVHITTKVGIVTLPQVDCLWQARNQEFVEGQRLEPKPKILLFENDLI